MEALWGRTMLGGWAIWAYLKTPPGHQGLDLTVPPAFCSFLFIVKSINADLEDFCAF